MNEQQLREQLAALRQAIDSVTTAASDKARLRDLVSAIETQLDGPAIAAEPQPLTEQVEELLSAFEVEHPTIAGILSRMLVTLSSMGL